MPISNIQPLTAQHPTSEELDAAFAAEAAAFREFAGNPEPIMGTCEYCGDPADDIETVESRDDETGYHEVMEMCGACRRGPKQREAEAEGGLRSNALWLLGIDYSWLYEGDGAKYGGGAVPAKPFGLATEIEGKTDAQLRPGSEEAA